MYIYTYINSISSVTLENSDLYTSFLGLNIYEEKHWKIHYSLIILQIQFHKIQQMLVT